MGRLDALLWDRVLEGVVDGVVGLLKIFGTALSLSIHHQKTHCYTTLKTQNVSGRFVFKTLDCCQCLPQAVLADGKHGVLTNATHAEDVEDLF